MAGNEVFADPSDTEDDEQFGSVDINALENVRKPSEIAYQVLHEDSDSNASKCCCCRSKKMCCGWTFFVLTFIVVSLGLAYYFLIYGPDNSFAPTPDPASDVPDPPDPPVSSARGVFNISVGWNQPDYHNKAITRYELQIGLNSSNITWKDSFQGRERFTTVTKLSPGTWYAFRVRALNDVGEGNYSEDSLYSTLPATLPSPPGEPVVRKADPTGLTVFWASAVSQGIAISGYELDIRLSGTDNFTMLCVGAASATLSCDAEDLNAATWYDFQVRALTQSAQGNGSWSGVSSFHTDFPNVTVPAAPEIVSIGSNVSWAVDLEWPRPDDGGSEILQYTAQRSNGTGTEVDAVTKTVLVAPPFSPMSMEWGGLEPLTTYQFRVRASNKLGPGNWSNQMEVTTGAASPPGAPQDMLLDNITEGLIALEWTAAESLSGPILNYELQRNDWWLSKPMYTTYKGNTLNYIETAALLPASTYAFQVRAINNGGAGPFSAPFNFTTNGKGGCGNEADIKVFFDTKDTMKASIQSAILSCLGKGQVCVVNTIHEKVGLSVNCAQCWAEEAQCTINKCGGSCLNPKSADCAECSKEKCFPGCVVCSGVPMWAYPP